MLLFLCDYAIFYAPIMPLYAHIYAPNYADWQAWCGAPIADRIYEGELLRNVSLAQSQCRERFGNTCGGAAECCTVCTAESECNAWTFLPPGKEDNMGPMCMLFRTPTVVGGDTAHIHALPGEELKTKQHRQQQLLQQQLLQHQHKALCPGWSGSGYRY